MDNINYLQNTFNKKKMNKLMCKLKNKIFKLFTMTKIVFVLFFYIKKNDASGKKWMSLRPVACMWWKTRQEVCWAVTFCGYPSYIATPHKLHQTLQYTVKHCVCSVL